LSQRHRCFWLNTNLTGRACGVTWKPLGLAVRNDRFCGKVAVRQSSGNGKLWPIPVLQCNSPIHCMTADRCPQLTRKQTYRLTIQGHRELGIRHRPLSPPAFGPAGFQVSRISGFHPATPVAPLDTDRFCIQHMPTIESIGGQCN
jgi:hypothetical protein